ncbi:adrenodoxin-like protein 2, mitochondrial [Diprion similis]|uniref:adrenodoxin-like protein 2, mitochondrial n=1 Tax=Diprion similis TaxID=362088 RepID=UPI001EF7707A|nr:adrenodoxin-like protein 2, mitochondrial [Diprion similis]XP_046747162.1 adrenodoxin-like protein 2, mitochondrial [Diprion similis]
MALLAKNVSCFVETVFLRTALGLTSTKILRTNRILLHSTKLNYAKEALSQKSEIKVTFVRASGERIEAKGKEGDSLLDVIVNNDIDLDGFGACEGTLTCSTCHLIFSKEVYDSLPSKPTDEELDMLDLAFDLTDTSRLGCQITLSKELDGLEVRVPTTINDARS